jgi:hypothetical protein
MHPLEICEDEIETKTILSDQHQSLISVGSSRAHCFRFGQFGAKSSLGEITRRLALCSTPDHFASEVSACGLDITRFFHEGRMTKQQLRALFSEFGLGCRRLEIRIASNCSTRHALWTPAADGVGACSNHIGALHLGIHRAVSGHQHTLRILAVLIECVNTRSRNARAYGRAQGAKYWDYLRCLERHPDFASESPYCQEHMRKFSQALTRMRHEPFVPKPTAEAKPTDLWFAEVAALSWLWPIPDGPGQWDMDLESVSASGLPPTCIGTAPMRDKEK